MICIFHIKNYETCYEENERIPILSSSTYLTNTPIIVVETSKQNNSAFASLVDVRLEIEASENLIGVTAARQYLSASFIGCSVGARTTNNLYMLRSVATSVDSPVSISHYVFVSYYNIISHLELLFLLYFRLILS